MSAATGLKTCIRQNVVKSPAAAGLVIAARVMVTKRGNRIGICTLDDRSGRLEVMLFTDALDKYQQLLEKDRILIVSGQVSFDDFSGGLKNDRPRSDGH